MYRKLTRNATVSVVQTVISGLVLFVLYRYLLDHLGSEQLGLWSVILASTSFARLSDMGLTGSVVKFVARYRALKNDDQAAQAVQTAAISIAMVMAVLALALYPLLGYVLTLAVPEQSMPQALGILPWAVFSLWLGSVGGVFQSGLDGYQRMDIRNILMIFVNLLFLGGAVWLVPHYGLEGLAVGQAVQSLLLLVTSWLALRYQLKSLPWVPMRWSKSNFKEMFGYAVNFQINSIAILLFDPITKMLMSRYGGLSSAAYYEMANQLVMKLRALIISASQALVPAVAELHETAPGKVRDLYLKSYRLLFFIALPFYGAILSALPVISDLWIGRRESQFLLFGSLLVVGWGFNTLTGPAYFFNLGTGDLKWNSIAHVVMAIMNVFLGFLLGSMLDGLGVAISAAAALIIGSSFVIFAQHKKYKILWRNIIPAEHLTLIIIIILYIVLLSFFKSMQLINTNLFIVNAISFCIYLIIVGAVMWFHPYKKILISRRAFSLNDGKNARPDH
ncbi:MAG: oligosaccharide flippase family protein [Rhodoferax sp.]|nr:oligosaccharide flippase family protein [Rhodoferax sp.]